MKIKSIKLVLPLLLLSLVAACATPAKQTQLPDTPQPIVLTDARGVTITLPAPAQRVISMAPSNTEILFAIGAGTQVVGRDAFSDYPAEAQQFADIGGGFSELNIETIIAAKPDLVLAADLTPSEQIKALEDLGYPVFALPNPADFLGLYDNLLTVASLTGHTSQAESLIEALKTRVAEVESKAASTQDKPLVFYELDFSDPTAPWTAGKGTFIDTLITMAGGQNLGQSVEGDWVQISVEELITQNPAIIILGDYTWGGVTPEAVLARPGWEGISALVNNMIYTFDDNLVSRPGPRLVDGLEAMIKLLHPELFK